MAAAVIPGKADAATLVDAATGLYWTDNGDGSYSVFLVANGRDVLISRMTGYRAKTTTMRLFNALYAVLGMANIPLNQ